MTMETIHIGQYLEDHPTDQFAIENDPIEIDDLPIKNGEFPYFCKRLPEGIGSGPSGALGLVQPLIKRISQS